MRSWRSKTLWSSYVGPPERMVANLLRVMRGAGRPTHLPHQIIEVALAVQEAGKQTNAWYIGEEIREVLGTAFPDSHDECGVQSGRDTIVRGSLQYLASNLVQQKAQAAAGEREMDSGMEELERAWERSRARYREGVAAALEAGRVVRRELKDEPKGKKPSTAEAMRKRARELSKGPAGKS